MCVYLKLGAHVPTTEAFNWSNFKLIKNYSDNESLLKQKTLKFFQ